MTKNPKFSNFQSFYAIFVKFSTDFVDWNVEKSQQGTNLLSSSLFRRDLGRKISRWSVGVLFEFVYKQLYSTYIQEVLFILLILLPKRGECGVSLEIRLNCVTKCNHIKVPATTLLAKRTYYISIPLRNVYSIEYSITLSYLSIIIIEITT